MKESHSSMDENKLYYYDEQKQNQSANLDNALPRGVVYLIFILLLILNILMNIDQGIIPAATKEIRNDLNIDDKDLGIFGSLVFVGNIIGAFVSFTLINTFNRKYILIISLILNGICLYCFTIVKNIWILFLDRVAVGVFQSFVAIYLPVWCDQFGVNNKKAIMISLVQVAAPLGAVVGYFLTTLIKVMYGWSFSFELQAFSIGGMILILLCIPNKYFASKVTLRNRIIIPQNIEENNSKSEETDKYNDILITEKEIEKDQQNNINKEDSSLMIPYKHVSICKNICFIFKQKIFVFCVLTLTCLYFVLAAVQYWASDYLQFALEVEDPNMRLLSFTVVCVTSPTLGVLVGGLVTSAVGGYESKHSILICLIFMIAASCFSIPVPLVNGIVTFTVFLWLVLFFGGAILSPLTGIILITLPQELAGSANATSSFINNLLGSLPAPFVYGIINQTFKDLNKRLAMLSVMYYSFFGVLFLTVAVILRYKYFNLLKKDTLLAGKKINGASEKEDSLGPIFRNSSSVDEGSESNLLDEEKRNKMICRTIEDDYDTPEFNLSHRLRGNNEEGGCPISHVTFQPFNKDEESLFGEKKVLTVMRENEVGGSNQGNEIHFGNGAKVCNSEVYQSL